MTLRADVVGPGVALCDLAALAVLAGGAGKLLARDVRDFEAVLVAVFHVKRGQVRLARWCIGLAEVAVGGAALVSHSVVSFACLTVFGVVFVAALLRGRQLRLPGGCGCVPWSQSGPDKRSALARAAAIVLGGVSGMIIARIGIRDHEALRGLLAALITIVLSLGFVLVRRTCVLETRASLRKRVQRHPSFVEMCDAWKLSERPTRVDRRGCDFSVLFLAASGGGDGVLFTGVSRGGMAYLQSQVVMDVDAGVKGDIR